MKTVKAQIAKLRKPLSFLECNSDRSLEALESDYWGPPKYDTHLVTMCHHLRTLPLNQLSIEHLTMAIGQQMSLPFLVPLGINKLKTSPLAGGNFYEGDLLKNVLSVPDIYFQWDKNSATSLTSIAKEARTILTEERYSSYELQDLIETFLTRSY